MQRAKCLIATGIFIWSWLAMVPCTIAQQMIFPGAEWETATPESQGVDSYLLQAAVDYLDSKAPPGHGVEELFIVRNGRAIWQGPNADNVHHTWSVTKSFASTALGLLIDDGLVTLDTLVADYVPSMASQYPDLTLRHPITHTSGYLARDEVYNAGTTGPEDPFDPGAPFFAPPGSQFAYTNTSIDQMMNVLTRVVGEPMQDLFQRRIGDAIGLESGSWDWGHYETTDGLIVDGGGGYLGRGISISAQDLARVGHLFLNRGDWKGEQLISSEWVDAATSLQVPQSTPLHPESPTDGPGIYGYGWWTGSDWFAALGYQQNKLYIYPDTNLVIARLGQHTDLPGWSEFLSRVQSAIIPTPGTMTYGPDSIYMTFDNNTDSVYDDQGDSLLNVLRYTRHYVGEFDLQNNNEITRLVTKFHLPGGAGIAPLLASAELRFYLHTVEGSPAGPVSLFHSVADNDEVGHVSDYEDSSYHDTLLDLVQVTDPAGAYYTLDVTEQVRADYTLDEGNPLSAFRLQVDGALFSEDNQSNAYQFIMPGASSSQPQLVLTFVPEPGTLLLATFGILGLFAFSAQRSAKEMPIATAR